METGLPRPSRLGVVFCFCITFLSLTGCALAPGGHISQRGSDSQWQGVPDDDDGLPPEVRRYAITPALLAALDQQRTESATGHDELDLDTRGYDYVVGAGDVLNITVWGHPELTIPAGGQRSAAEAGNWVHNDGSIFYPYVGRIEVAGLPITEIRELITERISRYIEEPQVDVTVAAFRSQRVYVSGSVQQPGLYPVTNVPMRVLDAINLAGGITELADWRNVVLTRDGNEYPISLQALYQRGDKRQNVLLRDGDVLHIGRADDHKVFVLGEVRQASSVMMGRNGLSLAEALSEVGGINELAANATGIFVMRPGQHEGEQGIDLFQLNARNATALVMADGFELNPRDIVYVTAAPVARWNRVLSQLLPTIQTVYFGARTDRELSR